MLSQVKAMRYALTVQIQIDNPISEMIDNAFVEPNKKYATIKSLNDLVSRHKNTKPEIIFRSALRSTPDSVTQHDCRRYQLSFASRW